MAQHSRLFIGINAYFIPPWKLTTAHARLIAAYFDSIASACGLPAIMPARDHPTEIDALLDRMDGVVLSSGLDIDPRRLGQPSHPAVQPMCQRRQRSDQILVDEILKRQMPVLGIALGMQQINVACG